jgi:plasmid stability protein
MKPKEATTLKSITVRIPEKLIERLKIRAVREHTSVQELARQAFEALLKQRHEEGEQ